MQVFKAPLVLKAPEAFPVHAAMTAKQAYPERWALRGQEALPAPLVPTAAQAPPAKWAGGAPLAPLA